MRRSKRLLVYGANGYTGRLLLEALSHTDVQIIAAGRNPSETTEVAERLGLEHRVFDLLDPAVIDFNLAGAAVVLNAAGPFVYTAQPLIDACLRQRVDYLDLSGEVEALEYAERCDRFARSQGIMLLPAVGFDVVPSDCLALHLSQCLPEADSLRLSISPSNLLSRGSAATLAHQAGSSVRVRSAGTLEETRFTTLTSQEDFGEGPRMTIAASWGDLVTAYRSTGIPDIQIYFDATVFRWLAVTANQYWGWVLGGRAGKAWLQGLVRVMPPGPSETERLRERSVLVGEVRRGEQRVRARMITPEAYTFTALAASRIVQEVLDGRREAGFMTPARLLGSGFAPTLPGVTLEMLNP